MPTLIDGLRQPLSQAVYTPTGESVDVFLQDQSTPPFDLYFTQAIGTPTALTNSVSIGDTSIVVDSVANIAATNYVGIFSGVSGENRYYFGVVLSVVDTTVTLDTPIDFAYTVGDAVISTTRELDVNGSVTTQTFAVQGAGTGSDLSIDVTRITLSMITDGAVDLTLFGDLAALANGLVFRKVGVSETRNIWNIKTNNDMSNLFCEFEIFAATNPAQGVDGLKGTYTLAGQDKHGVVIRLAANEQLQLLVQDDLRNLTTFRAIASGHIVED